MLMLIHSKVRQGKSFMFETTPAARSYASYVPEWRKQGYHVKLVFLSLPSAEVAIARVKMRVIQKGHDVPEAVIRRRFDAGRANFERLYKPLVDAWDLYDNNGLEPRLIAHGKIDETETGQT